jgi:hypothetical protein
MRFIRYVRDLLALTHTVLLRLTRAATVCIVMLCALAVSSAALAQSVVEIRVDANDGVATPSGPNPGDTWSNAYLYLQDAINQANTLLSGQNPPSSVELWVANGTYYPDITASTASTGGTNLRIATFKMENNLKILGGFAGGATNESNKNQRLPLVNIAILSGDIQQNDPGTISDNSFHIVTGVKVNDTAVIDGFTIRAGNADGADDPDYPDIDVLISPEVGAGMLLLGKHTLSPTDACFPLVMRCRFELNRAEYGAGVFYSANQTSEPIFGNCEFRQNVAGNAGGGFYSMEQISGEVQGGFAIFANCLFAGNQAGTAGAIYVGGLASASLRNCTIADNEAVGTGGVDSIVHDTTCPAGSRDGTTSLLNCIVSAANGVQLAGPTIASYTWVKELDEICQNNGNNAEGDPGFVGSGNYRLRVTPTVSPCIDSGSNALAYAGDPADINQNSSTTDMMVELDQRTRIGGVFGSTACKIDRGTYELVSGGCVGDVAPWPGGNNSVDADDLILVILHWGACPTPPAPCQGDVTGGAAGTCGNGSVDSDDLVAIILNWGPCPGLPPGTPPLEGTIENYEDCENLCAELEGQDAIDCMQKCFWYLCHEKGLTQFCE